MFVILVIINKTSNLSHAMYVMQQLLHENEGREKSELWANFYLFYEKLFYNLSQLFSMIKD